MSDTPRTNARVKRMIDNGQSPEGLEYWARDLERELNAANDRIKRLEEFVEQLTNPKFTRDDLPKEALLQRIKRLEEAGDIMEWWCTDPQSIREWHRAKEDKL